VGLFSGKTLKKVPKKLGMREEIGIRYPVMRKKGKRSMFSRKTMRNPILEGFRW
jgi:hypothetical protein